ncbi:hypothetical protein ACODT5_28900 [Streptomyces sp. 5.8]|uniref:hypothetical protein n=1 Tax=Streptomyces sp. 5.8 TaxID=3406571 RepID=UPI003BB67A3E
MITYNRPPTPADMARRMATLSNRQAPGPRTATFPNRRVAAQVIAAVGDGVELGLNRAARRQRAKAITASVAPIIDDADRQRRYAAARDRALGTKVGREKGEKPTVLPLSEESLRRLGRTKRERKEYAAELRARTLCG